MRNFVGPAHPNYEHHEQRVIVGLSGYARVGKDEVANILVEDFGFTRFAFADKLRDCVYALNPWVYPNNINEDDPQLVQEVIEREGWDNYKSGHYGDDIRRLLQRMGTEVGRDLLGEDTWVKELDSKAGRIVVSDMRFPNELERVVINGGYTLRIERPGIEAVNAHSSETSLDNADFDAHIINDGTLEDLREAVAGWAKDMEL